MELGEPDESGRRRPVVMEGSEYEENVDYIIEAIGQRVDTSALENLNLTRWNSIDADENTMTTNIEGVYAIGDINTYKNKLKLIVHLNLNMLGKASWKKYLIRSMSYF